ncbi:substrate-binding domain-containing protein [Pseudonocardia xishanensis]|uniref:Substrate-binding and VWA domain-containing protein n=1 Tax=Pseudonocardia xishanensis TaxID=630995 RepID=A0ABP8RT98_9PSEU
MALVLGAVLVVVVRALVTGGGGAGSDDPAPSRADRADCVPLNVTASSEKAALLSAVANSYNNTDRQVDGRCADVRVTSMASGEAAAALAADWNEAVSGPRPDVWSPAASSWAGVLEQRLTAADRPNLVPADRPSVAQTPLVIAMPQPMAEALGWPDEAIGWTELAALEAEPQGWGARGHPEWGTFRLGKTNPTLSTSGLNATVAAFFAATGRSTDLVSADVAAEPNRAFVQRVESGVVHYGDTTLTFLQNLAEADARGNSLSYISAVTVEEKSVWDYNQGNPSGDPATAGRGAKPRVPLVAIYPRDGTLLSDNPFLTLTAPWVDAPKQAAAADFLAYLREPEQQQRFTDAAFRSFEGVPGAPITRENGLLPETRLAVLGPPPAPVLAEIVASWTDLRKKANLVFVMDVSGSMGEAVSGTGRTRLDLAKQAAEEGLGLLGAEDTLSVWTFSTPQAGERQPFRVVVPPGQVGASRDQVQRVVRSLEPGGGTALYATTRAAVEQVRQTFDPNRINAVVLLTDGVNEYPPDNDLDGLVAGLDAEDASQVVRVFPIAYGEDASLDVLSGIAKATRAASYDAGDEASIRRVMTNVISNF